MITALYASILALIFIFLAAMVIKTRWQEHVAIGSGSSPLLEQKIRTHANFAEYTPFVLLLMFLAEYQGVYPIAIHLCGILYLFGRCLHIYGMSYSEQYDTNGRLTTSTIFRKYGMICTFSTIIMLAKANVVIFLIS